MSFVFEPVLYDGRPSGERLEKEEDCYALLEKLDISCQRMDHSPAESIEDCVLLEPFLQVKATKNLFLRNRARTAWYLLMMPGDKPFHTRDLIGQMGIQRLSFGEKDAMQTMLNLTPGSVSIMGLMYDEKKHVKLLIDREVVEKEYMRCHPCINTSTLRIRTDDVMNKLLPYIGHYPQIVVLPRYDLG